MRNQNQKPKTFSGVPVRRISLKLMRRQGSHSYLLMTALVLLLSLESVSTSASSFRETYSEEPKTGIAAVAEGKATITETKQIILDNSGPLQTDYVFDISHLSYKDEEAALSFFNSYKDNLIRFKVDFPSKKVTIHLNVEFQMGPKWTVAEWNTYLAEKAKNNKNLNN